MPKAKHKPWTSAKALARARYLAKNPPLWKTKGPFPFTKLPTEIQDMVLHFALRSTSEAVPIFYGCNTFRVVINPNHEDFALEEENLPAWILEPSPDQLAYIRNIHIEVVSDFCRLSQSLERFIRFVISALDKFSKLDALEITVIHRHYSEIPKCAGQVRDLFDGAKPEAQITARIMKPEWAPWERIRSLSI